MICAVGACSFEHGTSPAHGDGPDVDAALHRDGGEADAPREPRLVQEVTNSAAMGSPLSVTLTSAPIAGDVLVMIGAANHGALASVSGGGATWTKASSSIDNANIEIWFGVTDGTSSMVSIELPANPFSIWMVVSEWSGVATVNTLDIAAAKSGQSSPASAGPIITTHARDLLLFAVADEAPNVFGAIAPPWSPLASVESPVVDQSAWYTFVSAAGTYQPQVSETGNNWDAALVALELAP